MFQQGLQVWAGQGTKYRWGRRTWARQCLGWGQVSCGHTAAGFQLVVDPVKGGGQLSLCLLLLSTSLVAGDQLEGMASLLEDIQIVVRSPLHCPILPGLLGLPCGKGQGLLGRQSAACARLTPHCLGQRVLGEGLQLVAQAHHSVQSYLGSHQIHLGVESKWLGYFAFLDGPREAR